MMPDATLKDLFSHHPPKEGQVGAYQAIRDGALEFARVLEQKCPPCADRTVAIRKLRECVMNANASIALEGKSYR